MYAGAGILLSFSHGVSPPDLPPSTAANQQFLQELLDGDGLFTRLHADSAAGELTQMVNLVSEYDLGGEGDLFKAPEPIIEVPFALALNHLTDDLPMISARQDVIVGDDIITAETIKVLGIESIQKNQLNDVIYECEKDLLANSALGEAFSELTDVNLGQILIPESGSDFSVEGSIHKSTSAVCLSSVEWINGYTVQPKFLDLQELELGAAFGLRRAYSEGDIQMLGNNGLASRNVATVRSVLESRPTRPDLRSEERKEKLSRYWKKKSKRNFGHKIKYACRKALADSQPRVRGRFARTEDLSKGIPKNLEDQTSP